MFNLARIHEAIAEVIPDRECIVTGRSRHTWREVSERTRRLGNYLRAQGLGCHRERSELEPWESGQDHVALYLYNGNEYLEGMLGSYKARCAPFNVNYRYVEQELHYLFDNADAKAVIYGASFAPMLEKVRDRLPQIRVWLQVADGSGNPLLPGAVDYEQALAASSPAAPPDDLSEDDLYVLYTGGTTGSPKGVLWRQEDIFLGALVTRWSPASIEEVVERARKDRRIRSLPAPPFMHGAAHWIAFNMWFIGGTVVVQSEVEKLDPDDVWSTAEREKATHLLIVGDAFARPLLDQLAVKDYDLSSLSLVSSGGAIFSARLKREMLDRLPEIKILDALGSSESGTQASHYSSRAGGDASTGQFESLEGNVILKRDHSGLLSSETEEKGWLARSGRVPLGYYKDPDKTAKTFPCIEGVRYSIPGDLASFNPDGSLRLWGRDSVTINSGGEKIFAEEVELALKEHPAVYDALVVGTPSKKWGQQVTAVVHLKPGARADDRQLGDAVRAQLSGFKVPKSWVYVERIVRAPSGKADYAWARQVAGDASQ